MPFQQRTNTSWRSIRSQPAVSRRLFRCLGAHLLRSPLIFELDKIAVAVFRALSRHTASVASVHSPRPISVLRPTTSFRCRVFLAHSSVPLVLVVRSQGFMGKTKNPASFPVSRVGKSFVWFVHPLTLNLSKLASGNCPLFALDRPRLNT